MKSFNNMCCPAWLFGCIVLTSFGACRLWKSDPKGHAPWMNQNLVLLIHFTGIWNRNLVWETDPELGSLILYDRVEEIILLKVLMGNITWVWSPCCFISVWIIMDMHTHMYRWDLSIKYVSKEHYPVEREEPEQRAAEAKRGFENIRGFKRWEWDRSAALEGD